MNISRNNYEEFFLLYVDNELSAAERNAVELFVQENTDLKEELNLLQQTVFNADAIIFDNKNSLIKKEVSALQENLLLYIDGELSAADKFNTEKLLKVDIGANKELALLQQTKLQGETVVFANKKVLYRKEGGRVIDFNWRRIAAAAILLGFGTWATVRFVNTKENKIDPVAINKITKPAVPVKTENAVAPATPVPQNNIPAENNNNSQNIAEIKTQSQKNNQSVSPVNNNNKNVPQQLAPQQKEEPNVVKQELQKPSNNLPKPDYNNFNKEDRNILVADNVPQMKKATDINSGNKNAVAASNTNPNQDGITGYALNTKFSEGDTDNLSPDDQKEKKIKLGGFLRKVKRLVERTTNAKTGDGVKIAGFDIAIK